MPEEEKTIRLIIKPSKELLDILEKLAESEETTIRITIDASNELLDILEDLTESLAQYLEAKATIEIAKFMPLNVPAEEAIRSGRRILQRLLQGEYDD